VPTRKIILESLKLIDNRNSAIADILIFVDQIQS